MGLLVLILVLRPVSSPYIFTCYSSIPQLLSSALSLVVDILPLEACPVRPSVFVTCPESFLSPPKKAVSRSHLGISSSSSPQPLHLPVTLPVIIHHHRQRPSPSPSSSPSDSSARADAQSQHSISVKYNTPSFRPISVLLSSSIVHRRSSLSAAQSSPPADHVGSSRRIDSIIDVGVYKVCTFLCSGPVTLITTRRQTRTHTYTHTHTCQQTHLQITPPTIHPGIPSHRHGRTG